MAGQLDSAFKQIAKQIVSDLGSSLDTTITFIKKAKKNEKQNYTLPLI